LGIGDWAQSPIPNPQSPIVNLFKNYLMLIILILIKIINIWKYIYYHIKMVKARQNVTGVNVRISSDVGSSIFSRRKRKT